MIHQLEKYLKSTESGRSMRNHADLKFAKAVASKQAEKMNVRSRPPAEQRFLF